MQVASAVMEGSVSRAAATALRSIHQQHRDIHELVHMFLSGSRPAAAGSPDVALSGAEVVTLFEQIVLRVQANFYNEERYLMSVSHPSFHAQRAAHRRLAVDLNSWREALRRGDAVPRSELVHSLDGLLIHEAVEDAVFEYGSDGNGDSDDWFVAQ